MTHSAINSVYPLNILWEIKSRRIRWAEHVERTEDRGSAHRVMVGRLGEKDHLEDLRVDGKKILK
jgi:hypothetical protein